MICNRYPDLFFQSKQNEKLDRVMVISKVSPEQQQQLKDDDTKSEWDEVENMIGFSKVLGKITQSVIERIQMSQFFSNLNTSDMLYRGN